MLRPRPLTLLPYTTLFRSAIDFQRRGKRIERKHQEIGHGLEGEQDHAVAAIEEALDDDIGDDLLRLVFTACHPILPSEGRVDRKSTRLNSTHQISSYAVFC